MPFYFRQSINAGPFRINLSKSGVGLSVGIRGLRVGVGPKGHYIHAGTHGLYYRQTGQFRKPEVAPSSRPPAPLPATPVPDTWVTDDGVVMRRVISDSVETMQGGSRQEAVAGLNEARERFPLLGPSVVMGALATLLCAVNLGQVAAAVCACVSIVLASIAHHLDAGRRAVVFAYDMNDTAKATFESLTRAMDAVGRARKAFGLSRPQV